MADISMLLNIDPDRLMPALQAAGEKLNGSEEEVVLDFSSVHRMDSSALHAMEQLAVRAEAKRVRVVLRGVNVDVYKVLKLVKLTRHFSFSN